METTKQEMSADQMTQRGIDLMRNAYWSEVRETAQGLVDEAMEVTDGAYAIADREEMLDRIHETIDGHEWVIYTFRAQMVLLCSDNDGEGVDQMGADGFDWSDGIPWSQLAFWALERDVMDQLDALDLDINDDNLGRPELE